MTLVKEGETSFLSITFLDQNEDEVIPESGTYSIRDYDTNAIIVDTVSFTPSTSEYIIEIEPSTNTIIDTTKRTEQRIVTISYIYNFTEGEGELPDEYDAGMDDVVYTLIKETDSTGADLCTVSDVRLAKQLTSDDIEDELIALEISQMSDEIKEESENDALTSSTPFARKCCIFGVLASLESKGLIQRSRGTISSFSDGDFSVSYGQSTNTNSSVKGVGSAFSIDKYEYYLSKLMTNPFEYEIVEDGTSFYLINPNEYTGDE